MSRAYDIVVFGATSSVGVEIVKLMALKKNESSWAIAGRRAAPLAEIAAGAAKISGGTAPDVILADVKDPATLRAMAKQTKVILTTVGPYAKFGEVGPTRCRPSHDTWTTEPPLTHHVSRE